MHPTESLFTPAPVISVAIILTNIVQYALITRHAGPWLVTTMTVFFWMYMAVAFLASIVIYLLV